MTELVPLVEVFDFRPRIVEGAEAPRDGYTYMRGIVQLADVENKNKRVYPRTVWEKVLAPGSDFMQRLANNQVVGCLGHPESGKTAAREVSHVMTRVWMEDKAIPECVICQANGNAHSHVMGEEKILNTPDGLVLQELAKNGIPTGLSSRGKGSVRGGAGSQQIVAEDFQLDTFDFVFDPSTPGAWGRVVTEGVLTACANGVCCTTTEAELSGYRRILGEAQTYGDRAIASKAQELIEAIDTRLSTPVDTALSESWKAIEAASARLLEATRERKPFGAAARNHNQTGAAGARGQMTEDVDMITLATPGVKEIVEAEVARATADLRATGARALSEADELRAKLAESEANLAAAKTGLTEASQQLRNANMQLKIFREAEEAEGGMFDDQFSEAQALDAARQVIDELADENDVLREENLGLAARTEAAEDLMQRVKLRESRKAVVDQTERLLGKANLGEAVEKEARGFLNEATSVEDVNRRFGVIARTAAARGPAQGTGAPAPLKEGALPGATQITEAHEQLLQRTTAAGATGAPAPAGGGKPIDVSHLTESERSAVDNTELLMGRIKSGKVVPLARAAG